MWKGLWFVLTETDTNSRYGVCLSCLPHNEGLGECLLYQYGNPHIRPRARFTAKEARQLARGYGIHWLYNKPHHPTTSQPEGMTESVPQPFDDTCIEPATTMWYWVFISVANLRVWEPGMEVRLDSLVILPNDPCIEIMVPILIILPSFQSFIYTLLALGK